MPVQKTKSPISGLTEAKGNRIKVDFHGNGHGPIFIAGGRKRFDLGDGFVMVNGMVRFNDGTEAYALLELDETSSGEHHGTGIFLPDGGVVWQDEVGFCEKIGKTAPQVFPYKYKYTGRVKCSDHHIGSDGWSQ